RRNGLNRLIQGIYGRKNRLKHEEMKWLSQPRRISPLIRTFLSFEPTFEPTPTQLDIIVDVPIEVNGKS
ncbi:hypothetical protein, partial [Aeromonas hydrophila]